MPIAEHLDEYRDVGSMQFLEPTFVDAAKLAGLTNPDICDPADAIPAAAAYLKSNGAPADWERALYRYNPADWYPPLVMGWAERYGYGARVVWPVDGGRITQGFGPTSFALEPAGFQRTGHQRFSLAARSVSTCCCASV